jgi:para-nitrobenzyl esterase
MKKTLYTMLLGLSVLGAGKVSAQCPAGRYLTDMFPTFSVSTVTYSAPYNLAMDIYQPDGDTYAARPLIILAHGGSFIGGTKLDDPTVVDLCERFAKRGYVTASIDYRLGNLFSMVTDSSNAIATVIKAISDGKAAIRYFMKDAATTNTYRIDTNNIFVGGNSAGAVLYMHVGYLSSISECPSYIATAMAANGGFEGNSGNDGYTTKTKAVINLAGALNLTSFVNMNDKPSVNAQGTDDATVPYNCAYPLNGSVHVNLCGLGALESVFTANSVYHYSMIYPSAGHVPWSSDPVMMNQVDSMTKEFLYNLVCTDVAAVNNISTTAEVSLFPNPASELVNIATSASIAEIAIYDQTGRTVHAATAIGNRNYQVNTSTFAKGIYFVKMKFEGENIAPSVKRLIIN